MPNQRKLIAYALPMAIFVMLLSLTSALKKIDLPSLGITGYGTAGNRFWLSSCEYWMYPAQTILCGGLLIWFRREYHFHRPVRLIFSIAIGIAVFFLWISPQQFFGFASRILGFNPDVFAGQTLPYWATVAFRFLRLVVVVPFVEEIFWRGFLLRFLIDEDFERVPFGAFSWISFVVVTALFGFSHSTEDWIAAVITGAIYNGVAYRTRSLLSCVITHAVTNLLLGVWIMSTKEWGFW